MAALGGFLFGLDSGIINGTVEALQSEFGSDEVGTGFNVASMLLGSAVGAFFAGNLADKFGRRPTMILTAVAFIISAWGSGIAGSSPEFVFFRLLGGLAVGAASILAPAYISEIAPPSIRGSLATLQQLMIVIGLFMAFLNNYLIAGAAGSASSTFWFGFDAWQWMFWMELFPASIFFGTLLLIPESPRYLVAAGREKEARALIADFNLDGQKDIFVANGVYKDVTNQDFLQELMSQETARRMKERGRSEFLNLIEDIPSNKISNYAFRNALGADSTTGLVFQNATAEWGLDTPSFSNGAAYGDLDNDGDLDLVVNNLNMESFVYRNEADRRSNRHSLQLTLEGEGENPFGVGAQVTVETDSTTIYKEQMPVRGFQSTVGHRLTVGVGTADTLDRVTVAWPAGRTQRFSDVASDQVLTVRQSDAAPASTTDRPTPPLPDPSTQPFADVTEEIDLDAATHRENQSVDFTREGLIPKRLSTEGPRLAVGDVNGNGREDLYVGGAKKQPGRLLVQRPSGRFVPTNEDLFADDQISEDIGATFFDADGDGD